MSNEKKTLLKSSRVVIVVIDEARSLLAWEGNSLNRFRMLRRALIGIFQPGWGCSAVLVDTNAKIFDLTPPISLDSSTQRTRGSIQFCVISAFCTDAYDGFVLATTYWLRGCAGNSCEGY